MATTPLTGGGPLVAGPDKVVAYARSNGVPVRLLADLGSVRTVVEASNETGTSQARIGVTVLLTVRGDPMVVLVPGDRRVDGGKVARTLGARFSEITLASQQEVREITGYDTGTVPPFGHQRATALLVDERVLDHETLLVPAGVPDALIEVGTEALAKLGHVRLGDWSVPKEEDG